MKFLLLSILVFLASFKVFGQGKKPDQPAWERKLEAYKERKDKQADRKADRLKKKELPKADRQQLRAAKRTYQHGKTFPPNSYTISFDKDGKIADGTFLTSAYPQDSILILSPKGKLPASAFVSSITSVSGKLADMAQNKNPPDCVCQPIPKALISSFTALTESLTIADANQVLEYNDSDEYLPVKQASDALRVIANGTALTSSPPCLKITNDPSPVDYQLVQPKLDNEVVANHLKKTKKYYKGISPSSQLELLSLRRIYRANTPQLDSLLMRDSLQLSVCIPCKVSLSFHIEIVNKLVSLYPFIQLGESLYNKVLCDNQDWINRWLWYTGGEIRLNPFVVTDPAPLIRQADQQITLVEKQLAVFQTYIECCPDREIEYKVAKVQADSLLKELNLLKAQREDLAGKVKLYKDWVAELSVKSKPLYSGILPGSTTNTISWQHHYDAADQFNFVTPVNELPDLVAEDDRVVVLVHNVEKGDSISLKATEEAFTPKTKLEQGLEPFSEALAAAFKVVSPISGLTNFIKGLGAKRSTVTRVVEEEAVMLRSDIKNSKGFQKITGEDFAEPQELRQQLINLGFDLKAIRFSNKTDLLAIQSALTDGQLKEVISSLIDLINSNDKAKFVQKAFFDLGEQDDVAYAELIAEYKTSQTHLGWLASQTEPILSVSLKDDDTPAFRTVIEYPEKKLDMTSSKKVTYQVFLNGNKEAETKRFYTKYTLARWWPTVGIVYVPGNRTGSVFNDSIGTFKPNDDFDNFEALVGVKYYFKKTNPVRDHKTSKLIKQKFGLQANIDRGNAFWSTMFLTGGFGVRHKLLRNYYLGVGGDITPGLSWQTGFNFIFQKRYQLENGRIKDEYERPKGYFYLGLSIDPGVVTNLINIFR
ncbi:hypothetical protein [Spirosoma gilvum]